MRTYYTILVYFKCENVCGLKLIYSLHKLCILYNIYIPSSLLLPIHNNKT